MYDKTTYDRSVTIDNAQIAEANVMNRGRDAFIAYNVAGDCINPETGDRLFGPGDDPMTRFYADANNKVDYDAAASLEANIMYKRAFGRIINSMDKKEIRLQQDNNCSNNRYDLKYELGEPECTGGLSFRGFTMNTTDLISKSYYWEHKDQHKRKTGKDFPWPQEALEFFDAYRTPGNFMVLPYREGLDVGKDIKNRHYQDCFDLFLLGIYNFFLEQDGKKPVHGIRCTYSEAYDGLDLFMTYYLLPYINYDRRRFDEEPRQLIDDIEDGSNLICHVVPGWESFVELNLLQDFVTTGAYGHYREPVELWTDHFKYPGTSYRLPIWGNNHQEYWVNATGMIRKRSERIYEKMHGNSMKPAV